MAATALKPAVPQNCMDSLAMTTSEWRQFLQRWSDEWLASDEHFPAQVRKRKWLGFSPATDKQILQLEKRLGYQLPPSYRSFLLTTNGWLRTSMFIERIRPASRVDWLQSDAPELFDVCSPEESGDSIANYPPEEYFSYDGRPIYDREHFRGSIVIADPIPGDSMIYVLNPLVVATDGEWEAWRFANWIPGAERFPSFELLMRAEHELFSSDGKSRQLLGPYQGEYAPSQPRHAAPAHGRGRAKSRRLTVPELIAQLESPARTMRLKAANHLLREFRPHNPQDEHPEIVEPLTRILRSDLEIDVRSAAAAMLGSYGDSRAIEPLLDALSDAAMTGVAVSALYFLSPYVADARTADAMVLLLQTPQNLFDTEHAVHILEELRDERLPAIGLRLLDEAPLTIPQVGPNFDQSKVEAHQRSSVRFLGAVVFAQRASNPTEELVKRLNHANAEVRRAAVGALREDPNKGPHLAQYLTPLTNDADADVRQQATMTLQFLEPRPQVEIPPERLAAIQQEFLVHLKRGSKRTSRF
ncbi:MAG: HEAT repeat domain-containing protein [Tepidisphaeraceae bacterium]|jgi:HEAT repeat protein